MERFQWAFTGIKGKKLGLFPAGQYSENLITFYKKFVYSNPDFEILIFDNNPSLWGLRIDEYTIHSPSEINSIGIEKIIITHFRYQEQIFDTLKKLKNENIELIKFHNKDDISWFN